MEKIRVLIVDDSAVVRRILTKALSDQATMEVVGVAANGKIALERISQIHPDLVTLDVKMPVMDGLETLTEIRKLYPKLPVIMFSTITDRGQATTLEALARGANDYVAKPSSAGSVAAAVLNVQYELIPKILQYAKRDDAFAKPCGVSQFEVKQPVKTQPEKQPDKVQLEKLRPRDLTRVAVEAARPRAAPLPTSPVKIRRQLPSGLLPKESTQPGNFHSSDNSGRIDAIVIGTSTGGPNALSRLIPLLPNDLPVPIFVVQHMPPIFTARLAERLDQLSAIRVVEATDAMKVEAGTAYLAPGDFHLKVVRQGTEVQVRLTQEAPECSCRPSVDVLFRSAAKLYGSKLLAVVLTGMGQDGMLGCELVRNEGGQILAQDEATSVVWGMPGAVAKAGLAHELLPLEVIPASILRLLRRGRNS